MQKAHYNYNQSLATINSRRRNSGSNISIEQTNNSEYHYKYNGQERQDELGLNMYDMNMRNYDPAIGRWVVQDPVVHHSMSPYNAFDNNPVYFADPSGMCPHDDNCTCDGPDENGKWITGTNTGANHKDFIWTDSSSSESKIKDLYGYDNVKMYEPGTGVNVTNYKGDKTAISLRPDGTASTPFLPYTYGGINGYDGTVYPKGHPKIGRNPMPSGSLYNAVVNSWLGRWKISDTYSLAVGTNISTFLGSGTDPLKITLMTRGEPGLYFTPQVSGYLGTGFEANVMVTYSEGRYSGNSNNLKFKDLGGMAYGVELGGGLGPSISGGYNYSQPKAGGYLNTINLSGGIGIEGSPATAISIQGTADFTPKVTPIIQWK